MHAVKGGERQLGLGPSALHGAAAATLQAASAVAPVRVLWLLCACPFEHGLPVRMRLISSTLASTKRKMRC